MCSLGKLLGWTISCLFVAAIVGCGPSNRGAVSGQVSLDGQPVDGGAISFIPTGQNSAHSAFTEIKAGRYEFPVRTGPGVGMNQVEIHWIRKTGRKSSAAQPLLGPSEETVEAIPARYHSPSELKTEIKPGKNQVDFELKSK